MVVGLIEKYGLVPKSVYDESYNSSNSSGINDFLTSNLRDNALQLRHVYQEAKKSALNELGHDHSAAANAGVRAARQAKETMVRS